MDGDVPLPDIESFAALIPYLRAHGLLAPDEPVACERLTGGVSNRTVRVERIHTPHLVIKQALSKLRVPVDWFSSPRRIHREYTALGVLAHLLPGQVPKALFQDRANHIIAITEIPRPYVNWKTCMMQGDVSVRHWRQFGGMLARLHTLTVQPGNVLPRVLHNHTHFRSLRLEPYYTYAGTRVPEARVFLQTLVRETLRQRVCLVHGDYSPKNVLIAQDRLWLLDFEVCHVGDPAFDVGFALTHALSKGHYLAPQRWRLQEAGLQFWQAYRSQRDLFTRDSNLEMRCVHHTLACLLARVAGRSPLEYLDERLQAAQKRAVLALLRDLPVSLPQLIASFLLHIDKTTDPS